MISDSDRNLIHHLVGGEVSSSEKGLEEYSYIFNPDASIRWLYPSKLNKPFFLRFYSPSSFRANFFCFVIRLLFALRLKKFVRKGTLFLHVSDESPLGMVLNDNKFEGYSIFTGTVGENRKVVVELHSNDVDVFVKIALTPAAESLISNEVKYLKKLTSNKFCSLQIPELIRSNNLDMISVSNIKPKYGLQKRSLSELHLKALFELYDSSNSKADFSNLSTLIECKQNISNLFIHCEPLNDLCHVRVRCLADKCRQLVKLLERDGTRVSISLAHCDFTPWNMYCSNSVLHVFDWELARNDMPILFDVFHFVFQSKIMIGQSSYSEIYGELKYLTASGLLDDVISVFGVNVNESYIFYLVFNVSYYLNKYLAQEDLHVQAFWLVSVWEDALTDALDKEGVVFEK